MIARSVCWFLVSALLALFFVESHTCAQENVRFAVPGHEEAMKALNELHSLHSERAFANTTLWDAWLPHATLWTGERPRRQYRRSLLNRRIDAEGYVAMQQHRGLAHSDGWPFPLYQQSTGHGWHFSVVGDSYAVEVGGIKPLTTTDGWEFTGADVVGIDHKVGLKLKATGDTVTITTPPFRCGTIVAPFARLEWAARGLAEDSQPKVLWQLEGETDWNAERFAPFPALRDEDGMQFANVPIYRQPGYAGIVTRYRVVIDRAKNAELTLKSIITAIDTRHPVTNSVYLRACTEYFNWTGDLEFLRANIGRMRTALNYALDEFSVREGKHVQVPWVGHDGRSGLRITRSGRTVMNPGVGVGNNYWDLLPFGGNDGLATIYLFDALKHFAELERTVAAHADWQIPTNVEPLSADDLAQLAAEIKADFGPRFWNEETGRFFGWRDRDGRGYDYGFTFVNLEAIHYGIATPEQARSIMDWLDGRRIVDGDTSQGADIYHWRFAPRATTKRNVETYVWAWNAPGSIPWGNQVQDGGAVLGFSYFDLTSRLKTQGPDDAWRRLEAILNWFREVQAEGGYRAYYAKPGRGTLQGGGPPGGLGLDREFMESILVPQIMLYGFVGFEPTGTGFNLNPQLPESWPSATINRVHIGDHVLNITVHQGGRAELTTVEPGTKALEIAKGNKKVDLEIGPVGHVQVIE